MQPNLPKDAVSEALVNDQPKIYSLISVMMAGRDRQDVMDVLQETNLHIVMHSDSYDPSRPIWPWFKAIAVREVLMYFRAQKNARVTYDSELLDKMAEVLEDERVTKELETDDNLDALRVCIKKLPKIERAILQARYYSTDRAGEIAKKHSLSPSSLSKLLSKIRNALLACIRKTRETDDFSMEGLDGIFDGESNLSPDSELRSKLLQSREALEAFIFEANLHYFLQCNNRALFDGSVKPVFRVAARAAAIAAALAVVAAAAWILFPRHANAPAAVAQVRARQSRPNGEAASSRLSAVSPNPATAAQTAPSRLPVATAPQLPENAAQSPVDTPQTTQKEETHIKNEETAMNIHALARTAVATTTVAAATLTAAQKVLAESSVNGVWTGAAGDGLWATVGNWENGAIPSGVDASVSFPSGTNTSIQLPAQSVTIGALSGTTNFTLLTAAGQTFTLKDASGFGGAIDLRGGTLSLAGDGEAVISNLLATSLSTFEVQNAAATVTVARASGTAELDKTGAGFLRLVYCSISDRRNAQIALKAGVLELAAAAAPASVLDTAWFHIDASQTNTMTFAEHNGTNFITRLDDVRNNGIYATPPNGDNYTSITAPHAPWLQPAFQNGRPVIDFGSPAGSEFKTNYVSIGITNVWGGCLNWNQRCNMIKTVFLVISDREECMKFTEAWPFFLGDQWYYNFHRNGNAVMFHDFHAISLFNGKIVFDGNPAKGSSQFLPIGFHTLVLVPTNGVTANAFSNDRNRCRYGGQRLAEALIFTNLLENSDQEIIQLQIAAKWVPQIMTPQAFSLSGGTLVIPAGTTLPVSNLTVSADTTVTGGGTLLIQSVKSVTGKLTVKEGSIRCPNNCSLDGLLLNADNVDVAGNAIVTLGTLDGRNVVKQGAGTLQCDFIGNGQHSLDIKAGVIQLTGLPNARWFHIDASQTNTMTFAEHDGTNFITRLNDIRGNGRYAVPPNGDNYTSITAPHAPWLQPAFQNGRPVIDFGAPAGAGFQTNKVSIGITNVWGGCLNWNQRCNTIKTVFLVVSDREECMNFTDAWPFFLGDQGYYNFHRGGNAVMFHDFHAISLFNGKIVFDSNSAKGSSQFLPIGFHTLVLVPTNGVTAGAFSNDRGLRYGGQRLAEAIICTNVPSAAMQTNILAYFDAKWFGKTITNSLSYVFDSLSIAAGATLDIGLSPASTGVSTANSLSGAGTVKTATLAVKALSPAGNGVIGSLAVEGNLTLAGNAVFTLDTSKLETDTVRVSGALAIEPNGTFILDSLSEKLQKAPYRLAVLTAGSVSGTENLRTWHYSGELAKHYTCRASVENGVLYLKMTSKGTVVMLL